MDATPAPARVAVVVVPGVGNDAPGSTLDAVAGALASRSALEDAERHELIVSPEGDEVTYRTSWSRLRTRTGDVTVDVYEMYWADLSRFPAGLLRFAYTVYALLLQICTVGLEALRPLCGPGGLRRARIARAAMVTTGWIVAVPVIVVAAVIAMQAGALVIAVALDGHPTFAAVAVGALALVLVGLAAWGARNLARGGWRGFPPAVAAAIAALVIAHAALWIGAEGLRVGLANSLVDTVAYPLRLAWMGVVAAAVVSAVALILVAVARAPGGPAERRGRLRAAVTALLTLTLGPLGIAVVNALVLAAVGAVAVQVTDGHTWGGHQTGLRCLDGAGSWSIVTCTDPAAPADWGLGLFSQSLRPLVPVLGVAAALVVLVLVVAVIPVGVAMLVARARRARRREASAGLGRAMTRAVAALGGGGAGAVAALAVAVSAAGVVGVWVLDANADAPPGGAFGASVALTVGGFLVAVRVLGIDPRRPFGTTSGWLERLRMVLDVPYDVVNYLRVTQPELGVVAPRQRMLRRHRALLRHIALGGSDRRRYDALVFAAHSQGTVLTAATLFGDAHRSPPARPLAQEAPGLTLPPHVSLLTAGSPLRQLYEARFPGQYSWLQTELDVPGRLAPLTGRWVNLYRSGDYVGRALWADDDAPAVWDPDRIATERGTAAGPELIEHCLGPGGHTGYWDDAAFGDWLLHLVMASVDRPSPRPGPPSPPAARVSSAP